MRIAWLAALIAVFGVGCNQTQPSLADGAFQPRLPEHFPPFVYPLNNKPTEAKIELGRRLFFDPSFSGDGKTACANCHFPKHAYSDTVALSPGFLSRTGKRNAPGLFNLCWRKNFFKDGGVRNLELQVLAPLLDSLEMHFGVSQFVKKLEDNQAYREAFKAAFNSAPDLQKAVQAIASFERSLLTFETPFDAFLAGDSSALSRQEQLGFALFFSPKTQCGSCHKGVFLSDDQFYNLGFQTTIDPGRYRITYQPMDEGKFRTPSLRNISKTWPYMHDGRFNTLEEVLAYYVKGGENNPYQDPRIQPLDLDSNQQEALLAFMRNAL